MHAYRIRAGGAKIVAVLAMAGALLASATSALAGVGLAVTPGANTPSVTVGQTGLPGSITIGWANTAPNDTHGNLVSNILFTPSCGEFVGSATCPPASVDTGIFTLSATGTGSGCGAVTNFTIGPPNAGGQVAISPGFLLPVGGVCVISFTFDVIALPTKDADSVISGIQTAVLASAAANDFITGTPGGGAGSAEITFLQMSTTPGPGGTLGPSGVPPVNLSDSATILGLLPDANFNPASGTVTFNLYPPGDPTCAGAPFQSQTVDIGNPNECTTTGATFTTAVVNNGDGTIPVVSTAGFTASGTAAIAISGGAFAVINYTSTDATNLLGVTGVLNGPFPASSQVFQTSPDTFKVDCATTNTFTANAGGTWHWTAVYSGDPNNQSFASGCDEEPVVVVPATPTIQTQQDPLNGTTLAQDLNDVALLQDGFSPTGSITFTLYGPSDPTCSGAQVIFTSAAFPVNGNNVYGPATAPAVSITLPGTYRWVASYSGDANNSPVSSGCQAEPVDIVLPPPQLSIVKTPDIPGAGSLITAGDTATFTILLTNLGPGPALGVTIDDALPGPLTWSFVSTTVGTCNPIVGNVLHCDVGDLTEGASVTVVVNAPTSVALCTPVTGQATAQFLNVTNGGAIGSATNAATVTDPGSIACQTPNILISKTPDVPGAGSLITAGDTATFTIVLTNQGPGTAHGVTLTDQLPGPLTWSLFSSSLPGCAAIVGNLLTCNFGDLTAGQAVTVVVTAPTNATLCTPAAGQVNALFNNDINGGAIGTALNAIQVVDAGTIACQTLQVQISTTPNPSTALLGATLNDSATLAGGVNPTGTITFNLYAPTDPNCASAPAFTQAVPVSGAGVYSTSGGFVANVAGVWHWSAQYSGDANNPPVSSACSSEPVSIGNPPSNIPTLSEWVMFLMAALLAVTGLVTVRRRSS